MLSSPATTQVCNSLGWLLDDAASGQNFVDLKLCTACQSTDLLLATAKLDSKNRCYTLACWWNDHESQRNWTWKPFTKLVSRLFVYSSKLAGVSSDGSRLYSLDLQQNLRIQRQSPEQKLCYKARWFYGMVTSRPFTYLEPSIAARSSRASLNRIVGIVKLIPWAKWNVIRHLRWFPNYVWTDLVPSTIISIVSDSQKSKINKLHMAQGATTSLSVCKNEKMYIMYVNMETRKHGTCVYKCWYRKYQIWCLNIY